MAAAHEDAGHVGRDVDKITTWPKGQNWANGSVKDVLIVD